MNGVRNRKSAALQGNDVDANGESPPRRPASLGEPLSSKTAENEAVVATYALNLKQTQKLSEDRRPSFWRFRCSASALVGLLIWFIIFLIVYSRLQPKIEEVPPCDMPMDAGYAGAANRGDENGNGSHGSGDAMKLETELFLLPDGCKGGHCLEDGGNESFGAILGSHEGVTAYSNCYSHTCISYLSHDIMLPVQQTIVNGDAAAAPSAALRRMTSGMKWQCVEYARRYWMMRGRPSPAIFGSVDGAADIWTELTTATLLDDAGTTTPLLKYRNGAPAGNGSGGGSAPQVGDLLIYPRDHQGIFPYGHVAVVVGVELPDDPATTSDAVSHGVVYIAEQNWASIRWPEPHHNYSRLLPLEVHRSGATEQFSYHIKDVYHDITGWVRYA